MAFEKLVLERAELFDACMRDLERFDPAQVQLPAVRRYSDALVARMGEPATDAPEMARLFRQAMEIWLRELPSIPLVQWYHRIPHNETYWTNWPNARNPYINSAYWHRTWLLVLLGLQPVQP